MHEGETMKDNVAILFGGPSPVTVATPNDLVNHIQRRIERAKTLLGRSAMSVTEVGVAMGFAETSAFTSTFRRLTGITPSAYSRQLSERPS
jgi:AraC-like DNA-binding protein